MQFQEISRKNKDRQPRNSAISAGQSLRLLAELTELLQTAFLSGSLVYVQKRLDVFTVGTDPETGEAMTAPTGDADILISIRHPKGKDDESTDQQA